MSILYLTEQGTVLRKKGGRLLITKNDEIIKEISGFKLERVLIFGNIQITAQAMAFLLDEGIEVSFLSSYGKFRGRLAPVESKNIFLRIAQYERYLDEEFCLEYAKTMVEAKIKNGKKLIQKYSYNHPTINFDDILKAMERGLKELSNKTRVSSVMGIEGETTAAYFRAFGRMCLGELEFTNRSRRPPKDPINALLSFGYTLISNELLSILCAIGFDPYIGFFHGINYGRPSLALDIVEEFRHPVIDHFTLNLVNHRVLTASDFECREEEGIYLTDEARKRYFLHYEKMMTNPVEYHSEDKEIITMPLIATSYRTLFKTQAHKLMKTVQRKEPYQPFLME